MSAPAANTASVRITADASSLRSAVADAGRSLGALGAAGAAAGQGIAPLAARLDATAGAAAAAGAEAGGMVRSLAAAATGVASLAAAWRGLTALTAASDAWRAQAGALRLVSASATEAAARQEQVYEIAQRTRGALEPLTDLYTKLARSSRALGADSAQVATATEAVAQAMRISGGSAAAAEGAVLQLGQALSSGRLQGEEYTAMAEAMPRAMQAIADGMGVTVGMLKGLAEQGQITSRKVFDALLKQAPVLRAEFATVPRTVGEALKSAENSLTRFGGKLDEASGYTKPLIAALDQVRAQLDDPATVAAAAKLGAGVAGGLSGAIDALKWLTAHSEVVVAAVSALAAVKIAAWAGAAATAVTGLGAAMAAAPVAAGAAAIGGAVLAARALQQEDAAAAQIAAEHAEVLRKATTATQQAASASGERATALRAEAEATLKAALAAERQRLAVARHADGDMADLGLVSSGGYAQAADAVQTSTNRLRELRTEIAKVAAAEEYFGEAAARAQSAVKAGAGLISKKSLDELRGGLLEAQKAAGLAQRGMEVLSAGEVELARHMEILNDLLSLGDDKLRSIGLSSAEVRRNIALLTAELDPLTKTLADLHAQTALSGLAEGVERTAAQMTQAFNKARGREWAAPVDDLTAMALRGAAQDSVDAGAADQVRQATLAANAAERLARARALGTKEALTQAEAENVLAEALARGVSPEVARAAAAEALRAKRAEILGDVAERLRSLDQEAAATRRMAEAHAQGWQEVARANVENRIANDLASAGVEAGSAAAAAIRQRVEALTEENRKLEMGRKLLEQRDALAAVRHERGMIRLPVPERAEASAQFKAVLELQKEGLDVSSQQAAQYIENAGAIARMSAELEQATSLANDLGKTIGSALEEGILKGKLSFKSLAEDLRRIFVRQTLIKPFETWVSGFFADTLAPPAAVSASAPASAPAQSATPVPQVMPALAQTAAAAFASAAPAITHYNIQRNSGPAAAVPTVSRARGEQADLAVLVTAAAQRYGVDPALAWGVVQTESSGNARAVNPASGAAGLMQLMPGTARRYGVADPLDPRANLDAGVRVYRDFLARRGSEEAALAGYGGFVTKDPTPYISKVRGFAQGYPGADPEAVARELGRASEAAGAAITKAGAAAGAAITKAGATAGAGVSASGGVVEEAAIEVAPRIEMAGGAMSDALTQASTGIGDPATVLGVRLGEAGEAATAGTAGLARAMDEGSAAFTRTTPVLAGLGEVATRSGTAVADGLGAATQAAEAVSGSVGALANASDSATSAASRVAEALVTPADAADTLGRALGRGADAASGALDRLSAGLGVAAQGAAAAGQNLSAATALRGGMALSPTPVVAGVGGGVASPAASGGASSGGGLFGGLLSGGGGISSLFGNSGGSLSSWLFGAPAGAGSAATSGLLGSGGALLGSTGLASAFLPGVGSMLSGVLSGNPIGGVISGGLTMLGNALLPGIGGVLGGLAGNLLGGLFGGRKSSSGPNASMVYEWSPERGGYVPAAADGRNGPNMLYTDNGDSGENVRELGRTFASLVNPVLRQVGVTASALAVRTGSDARGVTSPEALVLQAVREGQWTAGGDVGSALRLWQSTASQRPTDGRAALEDLQFASTWSDTRLRLGGAQQRAGWRTAGREAAATLGANTLDPLRRAERLGLADAATTRRLTRTAVETDLGLRLPERALTGVAAAAAEAAAKMEMLAPALRQAGYTSAEVASLTTRVVAQARQRAAAAEALVVAQRRSGIWGDLVEGTNNLLRAAQPGAVGVRPSGAALMADAGINRAGLSSVLRREWDAAIEAFSSGRGTLLTQFSSTIEALDADLAAGSLTVDQYQSAVASLNSAFVSGRQAALDAARGAVDDARTRRQYWQRLSSLAGQPEDASSRLLSAGVRPGALSVPSLAALQALWPSGGGSGGTAGAVTLDTVTTAARLVEGERQIGILSTENYRAVMDLLLESLETAAESARGAAESWRSARSTLSETLLDLRTGEGTALSAAEVLSTVRGEWDAARTAWNRTASEENAGRLAAAGRRYLDASNEYRADRTAYVADWREVVSALSRAETMAASRISTAEATAGAAAATAASTSASAATLNAINTNLRNTSSAVETSLAALNRRVEQATVDNNAAMNALNASVTPLLNAIAVNTALAAAPTAGPVARPAATPAPTVAVTTSGVSSTGVSRLTAAGVPRWSPTLTLRNPATGGVRHPPDQNDVNTYFGEFRSVVRWATGGAARRQGVIDRPTLFTPHQMGEAGPEGLFPLEEMGNGQLGVRAILPPPPPQISTAPAAHIDLSAVTEALRALERAMQSVERAVREEGLATGSRLDAMTAQMQQIGTSIEGMERGLHQQGLVTQRLAARVSA